jgi:hypothetical protein
MVFNATFNNISVTVKSLLSVGRLIHEIKNPPTMKLGKQFDIDILANDVLE